jgi:hypothetical protein
MGGLVEGGQRSNLTIVEQSFQIGGFALLAEIRKILYLPTSRRHDRSTSIELSS